MTSSTEMTVASKSRNLWIWGFTPQAETWNGRLAMLGFVALLLTELLSGQGVLHFWHVMQTAPPITPVN